MSIFICRLFEVEKTITSWALRRPSYFNYIVPKLPRPISLPFPQTPSLHKHTQNGIALHANIPAPRAM